MKVLSTIATVSFLSFINYSSAIHADSPSVKPLWCDHETDVCFETYGNAKNTQSLKNINLSKTPPIAKSLKCLGCHDGVNAQNRAINLPGAGGYYPTSNYTVNIDDNEISTTALSLKNLSLNNTIANGHPVDVKYTEGVAVLKDRHTKIDGWDNADTIEDLLVDGTIQCTTCHNTHKQNPDKYLRHKNKASALCMTCHDR